MSKFLDLPVLTERGRCATPKPKPAVLEKFARQLVRDSDDRTFRTAVWLFDDGKCRACGRRCARTMNTQPNRGEVHHLKGRVGKLRHDVKHAVLLCAVCHARLKDANGLRQIGSTRETVRFVESRPQGVQP
jgi:hypothetical protein